jgi:hypothetical protein
VAGPEAHSLASPGLSWVESLLNREEAPGSFVTVSETACCVGVIYWRLCSTVVVLMGEALWEAFRLLGTLPVEGEPQALCLPIWLCGLFISNVFPS